MPDNLLVAVDGHSLMHRAFYALPPMNAPTGEPTNAVYGFLNMLLKAIGMLSPTHVLVVFDRHEPTFRSEAYGEYKATRKPMPDDLRPQFPLLRDALKAMGIQTYDKAGLEADDLLGIFSRMAENEHMRACLISGDRDILQLVSDDVSVMLTKKGVQETVMYDPEKFREDYGLAPTQLIEVKALMGDSSDNIPGVPGIGEKSALALITEYGSLENALAHVHEIKGKLGERLRDNAESARMSRMLAEIRREDSVERSVSDCAFDAKTMGGARELFSALGFKTLLARLPQGVEPVSATPRIEKEWNTIHCEDIESFAAALNGIGNQAFALETDSDSVSVAFGDTLVVAVFGGTLLEPGLNPDDAFDVLKKPINSDAVKVLYDAKRWKHFFGRHGIELGPNVYDVMLQAYILHARDTGGSFIELARAAFGEGVTPNASHLLEICGAQREELRAKGLMKLLDEIEAPLTNVLFEMERVGFMVDCGVLRELGGQYVTRLEELESQIYAFSDAPFNILSPKQLGAVLFETLGLPAAKKNKTGYSTDQEALETLTHLHPIAALVLEYRQLSKLNSTYVDGLLSAVAKDGRVHTTLQQTVAATGRISSTEPNLQNIPIRTQLGREIRKAFVAREGCELVSADYSQIELRVLAHMSGDEAMIRAFNEGGDIHASTAAEVFGCPIGNVPAELRSAAKAVNFGIVYGISDFSLAKNLGIPRKQAKEYIERYFVTYPGIKHYMEEAVRSAKERGYAQTLFGRRRDMPELSSSNYNVRSFGVRAAMNMPIQGTAADIIKMAMNNIHIILKEQKLQSRLILQVHDELLLEAPGDEVSTAARMLREAMESVANFSVPLTVSCEAGRDWYSMEEV